MSRKTRPRSAPDASSAEAGPADENRVAIVTGAARGTGAAVAKRLAKSGWRVVVNYRKSGQDARDTAAACRSLGGTSLLCRADVARDSDCRRIARMTHDAWGRIDTLVNNAGTTEFNPEGDLEGLSARDFQRIYATNVIGPYQMARAVAPIMRSSGAGSIVNVSSYAGIAGFGSSIAYAASKGALNTLTLGLARALAPEIRVNAVCPSFVETRWVTDTMAPAVYADFKARVERRAPLGEIGKPDEVAEAVLWFIEGGRLITGEVLVIDSGLRLAAGGLRPSEAGRS